MPLNEGALFYFGGEGLKRLSKIEMDALLREITSTSNVLSMVGMCKNAGKTTILNAVLNSYEVIDSLRFGLVSIGLDGEKHDRATNGTKPEIHVRENTLFITLARMWRESDVSKELVDILPSGGALGSLLLVRAKSDGKIQLSGPSSRAALQETIQHLQRNGADKILIDGSIHRRVLGYAEQGDILLCTALSCFRSSHNALRETLFLYYLYTKLPLTSLHHEVLSHLAVFDHTKIIQTWQAEEVRKETFDWQFSSTSNFNGILYRGAVTTRFLTHLLWLQKHRSLRILIIADGSRVVVSPTNWSDFLALGIEVYVQKSNDVKAIFVNHAREANSADADFEFMQQLADRVQCPVIDWKEELVCSQKKIECYGKKK